jgi:hypothetical protein
VSNGVDPPKARRRHHLRGGPKIGHNGPMSKPRVTFKFNRAAEGDWQIEAHYPGAEIRYIAVALTSSLGRLKSCRRATPATRGGQTGSRPTFGSRDGKRLDRVADPADTQSDAVRVGQIISH